MPQQHPRNGKKTRRADGTLSKDSELQGAAASADGQRSGIADTDKGREGGLRPDGNRDTRTAAGLKTLMKGAHRPAPNTGQNHRTSVLEARAYFEGDSGQCVFYCKTLFLFKHSLYCWITPRIVSIERLFKWETQEKGEDT